MRYTIALILIFFHSFSYSQDTLVFLNDKIEPVKILSIDTLENLIKYKSGNDTLIRSISSLSQYKLHSKETENTINFFPSLPEAQESIDRDLRKGKRKNNWFTQPSTYQYSGFSFGLDPTTFFMSDYRGEYVATNDHLSIYAEYKFKERIGLRLAGRIGLKKPDLNEVWGHEHNTGYAPTSEMIFEIGLEPTVYINKHKKLCFYIKPGAHFGRNYEVQRNVYRDYYSGQPYDTTEFDFHSSSRIGNADWYYRISLSSGLEINLLKHFSFGLEAGLYFGNHMRGHSDYYSNIKAPEDYVWEREASYVEDDRLFLQGAVNLIYRIGAKPRSIPDKTQN